LVKKSSFSIIVIKEKELNFITIIEVDSEHSVESYLPEQALLWMTAAVSDYG
jgi:hypothetical protein